MDRDAAVGRASAVLSAARQVLHTRGVRLLGAAVLFVVWAAAPLPPSSDAENFWSIDFSSLYREPWGEANAFVYSPAIALFLAPFTALPFVVFYKLLFAVNLAAMVWMVGWPGAALALLLPPVQAELQTGNIHLLIGAAIVLSFLHPAAWAMPILTKVTPAVGLPWFAARREWRPLAVAILATGAIVIATWMLVPEMWHDWFELLLGSASVVIVNYTLTTIPVFVRVPIAAGLVVIAGWRGYRWLVPVAVLVALPALWVGALTLLLAVIPLLPQRVDLPATGPGADPTTSSN